jgi:hypothetical protein
LYELLLDGQVAKCRKQTVTVFYVQIRVSKERLHYIQGLMHKNNDKIRARQSKQINIKIINDAKESAVD